MNDADYEGDVQQAVERLEELSEEFDVEMAHREADEILLEFVPEEVAEAFEDMVKWYA